MKTSESIKEITKALLTAQKKIGAAKKSGKNPHFQSTFSNLVDIMEACKDELNANGIMVLQPVMNNVLETMLIHETGEWMSSETPIVCKAPNDPQALGSAITYARRYGLGSMLFIPAEDDDAESANKMPGQQSQYKRRIYPAQPKPVMPTPAGNPDPLPWEGQNQDKPASDSQKTWIKAARDKGQVELSDGEIEALSFTQAISIIGDIRKALGK